MKNSDSKMFIEGIRNDFGDEYFKKALDATWQHIEYYEKMSGAHMKGKRDILEKLKKELENSN